MSRTLEEYISLPYAITIDEDSCDGKLCFMARHPELRGCKAQGWTPQEALANLRVARKEYLEALLEWGDEIPLPKSLSRQPKPTLQVVGSWKRLILPLIGKTDLKIIASSPVGKTQAPPPQSGNHKTITRVA